MACHRGIKVLPYAISARIYFLVRQPNSILSVSQHIDIEKRASQPHDVFMYGVSPINVFTANALLYKVYIGAIHLCLIFEHQSEEFLS